MAALKNVVSAFKNSIIILVINAWFRISKGLAVVAFFDLKKQQLWLLSGRLCAIQPCPGSGYFIFLVRWTGKI
ncbi:hypothetical protein [Acidocella aminolytica]|jgi:hypothetical protein|uniref:hypothetical protein n=1 Tax=Acidocella aminolytica TaxID=33998 RepID=UPI001114DB40|nr:hypothetical protein [Acidocella aminolytica]